MKKPMLFFSILIAVTQMSNGARAETEPPFFPVVSYEKFVTFGESQPILKIDRQHPWVARAVEYRTTWLDQSSPWLPMVDEVKLAGPKSASAVGSQVFRLQLRDRLNRPSAPLSGVIEVRPPAYVGQDVPYVREGIGCPHSFPTDSVRIEYRYRMTLPPGMKFEARHLACYEEGPASPRASACSQKITELKAMAWSSFDPTRAIEVTMAGLSVARCRQYRHWVQFRDEYGFETIPRLMK